MLQLIQHNIDYVVLIMEVAMIFEVVYIIGSGSICNYILKSFIKDCYKPIMLLYREHTMSMVGNFANRQNIENYSFDSKKEITDFLLRIKKLSLIISANNTYIFPRSIIEKQNLKIINFHNSLLPYHKGINAPTWSIYEMDKKTGITWHLVNDKIDNGDIIIQKELDLDYTETAIVLTKKLMHLGYVVFEEIKQKILKWNFQTIPMDSKKVYQMHYAKDIPNNGFYDNSWPFEKKSAFLRSLDWGCVKQFPKPILETTSGKHEIKSYKINNGIIELMF